MGKAIAGRVERHAQRVVLAREGLGDAVGEIAVRQLRESLAEASDHARLGRVSVAQQAHGRRLLFLARLALAFAALAFALGLAFDCILPDSGFPEPAERFAHLVDLGRARGGRRLDREIAGRQAEHGPAEALEGRKAAMDDPGEQQRTQDGRQERGDRNVMDQAGLAGQERGLLHADEKGPEDAAIGPLDLVVDGEIALVEYIGLALIPLACLDDRIVGRPLGEPRPDRPRPVRLRHVRGDAQVAHEHDRHAACDAADLFHAREVAVGDRLALIEGVSFATQRTLLGHQVPKKVQIRGKCRPSSRAKRVVGLPIGPRGRPQPP